MAEAPISISEHDWDRQKDNFIDLYHRRKLPLQSKNGGPSVIQCMRDEHNFCASLSQYEAQIRRWDMPKNLKRSEWVHIIAKMDDLRSGGVESRLKLAGSLVSADKIKQKRRRYSRAMPTPLNAAESPSGRFLWDSPRFTLEILAQNGQWSPYREEEASSHTPRYATLSSFIIDTTSRTLNVTSMPSNSPNVHYTGQRSIDNDAIRRPVPTISSDDALPLPWPRGNVANFDSYCPTEHIEAVLNPSQDTLARADDRNNSPRLPNYRPCEIFSVLGMERGFTLSPSSQELLLPIADAARSPFLPPGESLTWSPVEGNVDASIFKFAEDPPFLLLERHIWNFRTTSIGPSEQSHLMYESCHSGNQVFELTASHRGQSTTSIFQEIATVAGIAQLIPHFLGQERSIQNHQFNKFVDCLDSLLPDNMHEVSGYTSGRDSSSLTASRLLESPFHRAILYSTINSFAGLSRLPSLPLSETYHGLVGLAKSLPSFAVRSFIDNAFSAAVWNQNAQAVDFLLRMTSGTSYVIDVNKTITSRDQVRYMPIVVALMYSWRFMERQPRIPRQCLQTAEVLLKAGAASTTALGYLMSDYRCPDSVPFGFIKQLLDRGAQPDWWGVQRSMQHESEARTELLLAHIPRASYQIFFQDPEITEEFKTDLRVTWDPNVPILACTALYLRNNTATQIIKSVLHEWPRSRIEKDFPGTYERTMDFTLIHACMKGNKELVEFLLPLVARVSSAALVAAIRSRQQPLIELLLGSGVNVSERPIYLAPRSSDPHTSIHRTNLRERESPQSQLTHPHIFALRTSHPCNCYYRHSALNLIEQRLCNPLAQAIRSRNQVLVQKLEYTLSRAEEWYAEEALEAAGDVGDLDYLLMLLARFSTVGSGETHLTRALCLAIDQNRDDIAFALLDDGVDVSGYSIGFDKDGTEFIELYPLLSAIRGHRKELIEAILEHEPPMNDLYYIRAAAMLGDVDIVKVLLDSQAAVSLKALRTALKAGNEGMLRLLLDHFWRQNPLFQLETEESRQGMRYIDDKFRHDDLADIVRWSVHAKNDTLLVSFLEHGASVERRAIEVAMRMEDSAILEHLLAFAIRPGIKLDAVVKLRNQNMLRQWLSNGAGPFTESAFLYAMRFDKQSFEVLMEAFRARYPQGLKGWGGSLLKNAIRRGNSSLLRELLAARMDVNSLGTLDIMRHARESSNDSIMSTPLGFAIFRKKGTNIDDVQMLLDAGSEPNGVGRYPDYDDALSGWKTPLLLAIETGNLELIQVLLRGGANVNLAARNGRRRTPLQKACELCSFPVVELLLSWKADVNGQAALISGGTALQLTAIGGSIKIAKFLLQHGADVRAQPAKEYGRTPFEGAAEHGRLDMLKVIWDAAFPEGITTEEASNAIHLARTNGYRVCEQYIQHLVPTADILELSEDRRETASRRLYSPYSTTTPPASYDRDMRLGDESDVEGTKENTRSDDERSSGEEDSDWDDSLPSGENLWRRTFMCR